MMFRHFSLYMILSLCECASNSSDNPFAPIFPHYFKGYRYSVMHDNEGVDFEQAEKNCQTHNSHLTSVHGKLEMDFIKQITERNVMSTSNSWIGLMQKNTNSTSPQSPFVWLDGTLLDYTDWAKGEPHHIRGEDTCVSMLYGSGKTFGQWQVTNCHNKTRYYVCKSPAEEMSAILTAKPDGCESNGSCEHPSEADGQFSYCFENHRYALIPYPQGLNWEEAQKECAKYQSNLASIHSQKEMEFIKYLARIRMSFERVWIGLQRKQLPSDTTEVGFYWSDGSVTDYTNWAREQPHFADDAFCTSMLSDLSGKCGQWELSRCYNTTSGILCKKSAGKNGCETALRVKRSNEDANDETTPCTECTEVTCSGCKEETCADCGTCTDCAEGKCTGCTEETCADCGKTCTDCTERECTGTGEECDCVTGTEECCVDVSTATTEERQCICEKGTEPCCAETTKCDCVTGTEECCVDVSTATTEERQCICEKGTEPCCAETTKCDCVTGTEECCVDVSTATTEERQCICEKGTEPCCAETTKCDCVTGTEECCVDVSTATTEERQCICEKGTEPCCAETTETHPHGVSLTPPGTCDDDDCMQEGCKTGMEGNCKEVDRATTPGGGNDICEVFNKDYSKSNGNCSASTCCTCCTNCCVSNCGTGCCIDDIVRELGCYPDYMVNGE